MSNDTLDLDGLAVLAAALPDALRFDCVTTMDNGRAMLHALGTQTTHAVASTHAAAYAIQDALRLAFAASALLARARRADELEAQLTEARAVVESVVDAVECDEADKLCSVVVRFPEGNAWLSDITTIARLRALLGTEGANG